MATLNPGDNNEAFSYAELVERNLGFVTAAEQERLREARIFVCGTGGMGGACLMSLVRCGLGKVILADLDHFEVSNLNRQLFADLDAVGRDKVEVTRERLLKINPQLEIETWGADWEEHLEGILARTPWVLNGMDDVAGGVRLYRAARQTGATVVDAYTSPLPSVIVVRPEDPRPEERLSWPSRGRDPRQLDDDELAVCARREIEYVMTHSSSRHHVDLDVAAEMLAGQRSRMSFAPMVITTGNLMCFEMINLILERPSATDCRGYFLNPWTARIERPRHPLVAAVVGWMVRRFLQRMVAEAGSEGASDGRAET